MAVKITRKTYLDPETVPKTWREFTWPDWVPDKVRREIKEFWKESFGRSPQEWSRDNQLQGTPGPGCIVGASKIDGRGSYWVNKAKRGEITGRFLHCWNNIGVIIDDYGDVFHVAYSRR